MSVRFGKFASAGVVGTSAHYAALMGLVQWGIMAAAYAAMLGAGLGALVNYWITRTYVYRSRRPHGEALPRFLLMALVGLCLNGLLVGLMVSVGVHYLVAQVVTTLTILCLNYGVSTIWVFQQSDKPAHPPRYPPHTH